MKHSMFFMGIMTAVKPKLYLRYLRDYVKTRAELLLKGGRSAIKYDDYTGGYDVFNYVTNDGLVVQKMRINREDLDGETLKDDLSNIVADVTVDEACLTWQRVILQAGGKRRSKTKRVRRNRRHSRRN